MPSFYEKPASFSRLFKEKCRQLRCQMCRNILADLCEQLPRCVAVLLSLGDFCLDHCTLSTFTRKQRSTAPPRLGAFRARGYILRVCLAIAGPSGNNLCCQTLRTTGFIITSFFHFLQAGFLRHWLCTAELTARWRTTPMTILIRTKLRCQNLLTPARSWNKENNHHTC